MYDDDGCQNMPGYFFLLQTTKLLLSDLYRSVIRIIASTYFYHIISCSLYFQFSVFSFTRPDIILHAIVVVRDRTPRCEDPLGTAVYLLLFYLNAQLNILMQHVNMIS